jgi:proteasome lid subunit RPN8/RPN11
MMQSVYRQVLDHLSHDTSREHGGLLLGYEIQTDGAGPAVVVAHSLPAHHTKGTPVRLEIQEDSWAEWDRISDRYARGYGWRRVGWYHSHPGIRIFLSRWDLDVCRDWERPTHVALVVDPIDNRGGFFVRGEEGFRSDSPQSFFEIHNVSSSSIVTWSNVDPEGAAPEPEATPQSSAAREPEEVSPISVRLDRDVARRMPSQDRIWLNVTIVTLLLLLFASNSAVVWFVRRIPRETANLQTLSTQIGELRAEVAKLQPPPAAIPPPSDSQQAGNSSPAKQPANPLPTVLKFAIAKSPKTLKPSETFQFKVNGNPAPEVTWSIDGPGVIDSFYGLYRAPDQFTGEPRVKVTATRGTEAQSVSFTLKGTSKETGKRSGPGGDPKQADGTTPPADGKPPGDAKLPAENTGGAPQQQ